MTFSPLNIFLKYSCIKELRGETDIKGIYISCLCPHLNECYDNETGEFITPIFNLLMEDLFSELSKKLEVGM